MPNARLIEKVQCYGKKRTKVFQIKIQRDQKPFPTDAFSTTKERTSQLRSSSSRNCYIGLFRLHTLSKHYFASTVGRGQCAEILNLHSYISFIMQTDPLRNLIKMLSQWTKHKHFLTIKGNANTGKKIIIIKTHKSDCKMGNWSKKFKSLTTKHTYCSNFSDSVFPSDTSLSSWKDLSYTAIFVQAAITE